MFNRPSRLRIAARLILSAGLVLLAWLLATCGAPGAPAAPAGPASADADVLVEYRRTGGIAGLNDHLIIRSDASATLQQKGQPDAAFTVDPQVLDDLKQTLEAADFDALAGVHEPGRAIPDAFHYTVVYTTDGGRQTVEATDGAIPDDLAPVLDQLNTIISQH